MLTIYRFGNGSSRAITLLVSLVVLGSASTATAENITRISVQGVLRPPTTLSSPPPVPRSFQELSDSAFYSFSTALGVRDIDRRELHATIYFWHTAPRVLAVRAYVSGTDVGAGTDDSPIIVGQGRLSFTTDGRLDVSALPPQSDSGYLLDRQPLSLSDRIAVSVAWLEKPPSRIELAFDSLVLSQSASSSITSLVTADNAVTTPTASK